MERSAAVGSFLKKKGFDPQFVIPLLHQINKKKTIQSSNQSRTT